MNKALPKIKENEAELHELIKSEPQIKRQDRLRALYLVVTKQASSRSQLGELLNYHRNTIAEWFSLYERGGLERLLEMYRPSGAAAKIPAEAVAEISAQMETAKGYRTYKEIHEMVVKKYKVEVSYRAVHELVRYRLGGKLKVARPTNPKKTKRRLSNSRPD